MADLIQFKLFQQFSTIDHGISTRHTEHRQPYHVKAEQVHSNTVTVVTNAAVNILPQTDGLITRQPGIRLRIGVSDCVPILVYNPKRGFGGVLHAGFLGTIKQILPQALIKLGARDSYVGIGPAIGPCCYNDIDIQVENVHQAKRCGVPLGHIEMLRACTQCNNDKFYSHRAGDSTNFGIYFEIFPPPLARSKKL